MTDRRGSLRLTWAVLSDGWGRRIEFGIQPRDARQRLASSHREWTPVGALVRVVCAQGEWEFCGCCFSEDEAVDLAELLCRRPWSARDPIYLIDSPISLHMRAMDGGRLTLAVRFRLNGLPPWCSESAKAFDTNVFEIEFRPTDHVVREFCRSLCQALGAAPPEASLDKPGA